MRFRVHLTRQANGQLREIYRYVAAQSPDAAARWFAHVCSEISNLCEFPARCPIAPESTIVSLELRHLLIGSYRVIFQLSDDAVVVLHVRHAARLPADDSQ